MSKTTLQTLERGLHVLELVAESDNGISINELAERLDIHRTIIYRIIATLENANLVHRSDKNRIYLAGGILQFSNQFLPQIRSRAGHILKQLAKDTNAAAFISVAENNDCAVIAVAENETASMQISYRIGSRHPLHLGAAGLAILSSRPAQPNENPEIQQARQKGFSYTKGQIQAGASGLATPIQFGTIEAAIGVVTLSEISPENLAPKLLQAKADLENELQKNQ